MGTIIQRVCQYCFADMGTKDGKGMTGTSHGICKGCLQLPEAEQMAVYKAALKQRALKLSV
jgi:hypothetical protein